MIARVRASRFVECVFTSPVDRCAWLTAKLLVLLSQVLLWTPGRLVVSIAVGGIIGVLFIGRSLAAPASAGMGVLLFYAGLIPLQELMLARGNGATKRRRI